MKLQTAELLENNAAARFFTSKTLTLGGNISVRDKRVKITDLDQEPGGAVWVNKGLFVLAAGSLAYVVPVDAEEGWEARFGLTSEPMKRDSAVALRDATDTELVAEAFTGLHICTTCGKQCDSATGLSSHMRSHKRAAL